MVDGLWFLCHNADVAEDEPRGREDGGSAELSKA